MRKLLVSINQIKEQIKFGEIGFRKKGLSHYKKQFFMLKNVMFPVIHRKPNVRKNEINRSLANKTKKCVFKDAVVIKSKFFFLTAAEDSVSNIEDRK